MEKSVYSTSLIASGDNDHILFRTYEEAINLSLILNFCHIYGLIKDQFFQDLTFTDLSENYIYPAVIRIYFSAAFYNFGHISKDFADISSDFVSYHFYPGAAAFLINKYSISSNYIHLFHR